MLCKFLREISNILSSDKIKKQFKCKEQSLDAEPLYINNPICKSVYVSSSENFKYLELWQNPETV